MATSLTHYAKKLPILNHVKPLGEHVKKHHKKYLVGAAGIVGLIKLFSFLIVGLSGSMIIHGYNTGRTVIDSPSAGSTQSPSGFNVSFLDDGMVSQATYCYYTVTDNGIQTANEGRDCNSDVWISVGIGDDCSHNGIGTCVVAGTNEDADGNMSNNSTTNFRAFSIAGVVASDTTPPTGGSFKINNDAATTTTTGVYLKTTCATDPSGVQVAFGNTPSPTNRQTCSAYMSHTLLTGDGTKTVYMRFKDGYGNMTADITDTILLSTTTYEYVFSIVSVNTNTPISGSWLTSSGVVFSWTIANANLIGGYHIFTISGNNTYEGLYNGTYTETRTLADGPYTRALSFDDGATDTPSLEETFYVDTLNPTGTILINNGSGVTNAATVTLSLTGTDANGISGMQFSCNNSTWSTTETYVTSKSFNMTNYAGAGCTTSEGTKYVYVKYLDKSSKRSSGTIRDTIIYDITPPVAPTLSCTNFTSNVVSNYAGTTTCSVNNTAAPSPAISVEYSLNSGSTWTDIGSSNLSHTFTPAQGTTSVIMRITDYGGGPTNSNTYIIIKSSTAPTITINNPTTTAATSKTITATASTGTLTMTTGSVSTTCDATRTFISYASTTFSSESDNGKYVCYRAIDTAGNTGFALSTMITGITTTSSATPSIIPEPVYTSGTSNTVFASDLISESSIDLYQFCISTTNSTGSCTLLGAPSTVAYQTYVGLVDGTRYYYFLRIFDNSLGARSNWSASVSSTQDATTPVASIVSPAAGSTQTTSFAVRFTDTETTTTAPMVCAYRIEDGVNETLGWTSRTCNISTTIDQATYCPHAGNSCTVFGFAADTAGNQSAIVSRSFTIAGADTTAPVLAQVTPVVPSPTSNHTPSYTFSSSEAGTIDYGGSCSSSTTTAIAGNTTVTFNYLADGTYSDCKINVTDAAGNQSSALAVNTFVINTSAPTLIVNNPGTTPAMSKTITASTTATLGSFSMTAGSTNTTCDDTRTFIPYASTTFTTEADNGKYVCYRVINSVGTSGYALSTIIGGIDTTKPTCTISYLPSSATNQNVLATCTPSETATFQSPVGTGIYTFSSNSSYPFNFTDTAGNTGTVTATVSWIDKTAPTLTQITPVPTPSTITTPSYTFNSSEAGTINYVGSCTSSTTTAIAGNTTVIFNALATGTYTDCTITVTDSVGNVSTPLAISGFTISTTALTAPLLSTLSGDTICPSLPTLFTRTASTNSGSLITGSQLSGYRYEVSSDSGMTTTGIVLSGTTTTTGVSLALSTLSLGTYSMRVQAINALGTITYSNIINFVLSTQYCNTRGTGIVISTPTIWLRNVNLDTIYRSDPILILGFTGSVPISISTGMLFINNSIGTGSGTTGMITANDTVYIEMVSSDIYDTTLTSTISVLGLTGSFSLTTKKNSCTLSAREKIIIQNIYSDLKDQYNNDLSKLADFLTTFQSMVQDESELNNSCNLDYLLLLIENDLDSEGGIDTSDHITPNCKEYTIAYDNDQRAYYAPEMINRYYFINREALVRHLDYYNPGDCHVNTYTNIYRATDTSDPMRHIAPNGKIYNFIGQYGGFSATEFITPKYFDSLESIVRYIDIRNPAKDIWNHTVDTSFSPITYTAPNSKTYKIYKTDRGYMSYKLITVKYFGTLTSLESYINTNNPSK